VSVKRHFIHVFRDPQVKIIQREITTIPSRNLKDNDTSKLHSRRSYKHTILGNFLLWLCVKCSRTLL